MRVESLSSAPRLDKRRTEATETAPYSSIVKSLGEELQKAGRRVNVYAGGSKIGEPDDTWMIRLDPKKVSFDDTLWVSKGAGISIENGKAFVRYIAEDGTWKTLSSFRRNIKKRLKKALERSTLSVDEFLTNNDLGENTKKLDINSV